MSNAFLEHHDKWAAKKGTSSSYGFPILKLPVGTTQFRVLDEVPTSRIIHFKSIGGQQVICPEERCLFCARGDEFSIQHFLNVLDRSDNKVKVLIYSDAAARAISELIQEVAKGEVYKFSSNHPKDYDIQVVRTGTGKKDTRYVASGVETEFDESLYTPFDLESKLVPMSVEEQKQCQGNRDVPSSNISSRGLRRWTGAPPSQVDKTSPVETVIEDDDNDIL